MLRFFWNCNTEKTSSLSTHTQWNPWSRLLWKSFQHQWCEATGTLAGYTGTPSAPRHPASCGVRYCTTVLALDAFGYDGKWAVSVDHYSMDSAEAAEGTLSNGDKLFSWWIAHPADETARWPQSSWFPVFGKEGQCSEAGLRQTSVKKTLFVVSIEFK